MQYCNAARIDTAFLKVRVFADSVEKNRKAKTTWKSGMPFRIVYNLRDRVKYNTHSEPETENLNLLFTKKSRRLKGLKELTDEGSCCMDMSQ